MRNRPRRKMNDELLSTVETENSLESQSYGKLAMSFDAENDTMDTMKEIQTLHNPLQQQREQREMEENIREKQNSRDAMMMQLHEKEMQLQREQQQSCQREPLHQFGRSLSNLLFDLPPLPTPGAYPPRSHESNYGKSTATNLEADMSISDLFGLGLPRGSLMGSQSSTSSQEYRQQQQRHGQNSSSPYNYSGYENDHGYCSMQSSFEMPGTPNSLGTSGSPSTPGSVYTNPYNYAESSPPSSYRSHFLHGGSPPTTMRPNCYGRPIRGSTSFGRTSAEFVHMMGCNGTRSNSPSDSDASGTSGEHSSISDMMSCLSLNNINHSCHQRSSKSMMNSEMDMYNANNRAVMQQHMAMKKCMRSGRNIHQEITPPAFRNHHCCSTGNHMMSSQSPILNEPNISLDRAARFHKNAAALCEATYTWSGTLLTRTMKPTAYSSKVFLGGLQWDITEALLIQTFKQFGQIKVEWPGKEQSAAQPKGYAYIIFESEKQVKSLLSHCTHDFTNGSSWYYRISSKRMKGKEVQVIPWVLSDSNFSKSSSQKLDPGKTVFVGALHGMLTAEGLAKIMDDLFNDVIYAGIDTDKFKYPIGSARITFSSKRSYKKAVAAGFIEIKTPKFTKKIQVDPYLEDTFCSGCSVQQGPYFCRDQLCSRYFCRNCWIYQHSAEGMRMHEPMTRSSKAKQVIGLEPKYSMNGSGNLRGSYVRNGAL